MAAFERWLISDLKKPLRVQNLGGNIFSQDSMANLIGVEVLDDGKAATLSGKVTGYIIRGDGLTVLVTGTLTGNKASIVLPAACYAIVGTISIVVKVGTMTIGAVSGYVYRSRTDAIVDPEDVIPDITELLEKIAECEAATKAANEAAANANSKANTANTAASTANTAAQNANEKANAANKAASTANTAAGKIDYMTVAVTALTAGATPTVKISEVDGHKHIVFGIPKGDKGDKGNTGSTPNIGIGTVTTGEPGTSASASMSGTTDNPLLNLTIPRGMPGDNNNVLLFDENGNLYINVNED